MLHYDHSHTKLSNEFLLIHTHQHLLHTHYTLLQVNYLFNKYHEIQVRFDNIFTFQNQLEDQAVLQILTTVLSKIFETNSSFYVKQRTTQKVKFPFSRSFVLVLTKFLFWKERWSLGYDFTKFRDFPDFGRKTGHQTIILRNLEILLIFSNFIKLKSSVVWQLVYIMFITNNQGFLYQ